MEGRAWCSDEEGSGHGGDRGVHRVQRLPAAAHQSLVELLAALQEVSVPLLHVTLGDGFWKTHQQQHFYTFTPTPVLPNPPGSPVNKLVVLISTYISCCLNQKSVFYWPSQM